MSAEIVFEVTPICMIRATVDRGGLITGGAAHVGRLGAIRLRRSCTTRRALMRSVFCLKIISIDDNWATVVERMSSSPGTPLSVCSSGTVTNSSVSSGESPSVMVWTSTRGGANSGKASVRASLSWLAPNTISAIAAATTMKRYLRLDAMIQRIIAIDVRVQSRSRPSGRHSGSNSYSVPNSSAEPTVTTAVPAGGPCDRIASPFFTVRTLIGFLTKVWSAGLV